MEKGKYYITTAIAYTSKIPHIGNAYEAVLTDAIARYKRKQGYDVHFVTGTDEHGQKIENTAKEFGRTPQEHVDVIAGEIKRIWDRLGVSYDYFIRTTDANHKASVQNIFKKLYDQGDIYKSKYEGLYCIPCESFYTETQLVEGKCPDCGREVEKTSEEAYFLKLSKYQERLEKHIEENPDFIYPESRKKEMLNNFIKPGLQDLCVSRSSFKWGIPVKFDEGHVTYVWIDALSNYITALGYDPEKETDPLFEKNWPADVHIVGKDIVRFHTIYWPIILMALGIELPKKVYGHPWLLTGSDKMSKSKGNVIYADDLVDAFGLDPVRYYLLREMPFANDGNLTYENLIARTNADLANTLGNLVNRTVAMVNKYFDGKVYLPTGYEEIDNEVISLAHSTVKKVDEKMNELRIAEALEEVFVFLRRSNKYIDETTPWILGRDESGHERLKTVLYVLLENIRIASVLLDSFIPETTEKIFGYINTDKRALESVKEYGSLPEGTVNRAEPLFVRIDEEVKLKELYEDKDEVKVTFKEEISFDDFTKLDLKVATVIEAEKHPKADRLLVLKLKVGNTERQVVSGIAAHYSPEELVGKNVILVANLKPVKLRGVKSEGMVLAATLGDDLDLVTSGLPSGAEVS